MTARVAIKGGTLNRVITNPENTPTVPQRAIAPKQQTTKVQKPADTPPPFWISHAVRTAERAIKLPTARSMPPVMITMVIPTAIIAITEIWSATLRRLDEERKVERRTEGGD